MLFFLVKLRNSFKGKYLYHLTRVLVWFPETKGESKSIVPHFSRGENVVHLFFALSQLQGVEGGWPGRREPDDEHSPAS